ncbi:hypothetical protein [Sphingobacterium sp. SYP-B4668]|uniref:hypothetical protein n=1 Tax=Sphingobacterium sp. SYP-B4668 TaxID=2996035 RepID=UPI0022DE15E8|nr:hypothetical protein [Sphingobacterium sp. SYP-B4668]
MKKSFRLLTIAFGLAVIGITVSCNKDADVTPDLQINSFAVAPAPVGDSVNFTATGTKGYLKTLSSGVYGARNFHQGTVPSEVDTSQWRNPASTYYYNLNINDGGTSANYDFLFTGTANSSFTVNTATYDLFYVNTTFNAVVNTTPTGRVAIPLGVAASNSTSGSGDPSSAGWYIYNISNHIMSSFQPRTYILVNKGTGSNWKIKLNSVYWNGSPNSSFAATNFPFMSFDYSEL